MAAGSSDVTVPSIDSLTGRQLRTLVTLADEGHFGRAANRLGVSQPSLSQLVRRIEIGLGEALFTRRPTVGLTPAGERFVSQARRALGALERGLEEVDRLRSGAAGRLDITFASSTVLSPLPALLRRFRTECPGVDVRLRRGSSGSILEALSADEHVGVLRYDEEDPDEGFRSIPVHVEPFVAALPATHPRAGEDPIELSCLANESFVSFPCAESPRIHEHLVGRYRSAGFVPRVVVEVDDWLSVLGLVDAGLGVALVPQGFRAVTWGGVVYAGLAEPAPASRVLVCARVTATSPVVERFLGTARRPA